VVAQSDSPPVSGSYPTSCWEPEEVVTDLRHIALPASLSPGQYRLLAGLYRLETMERLPREDGGDTVDLGTVRVRGE